MMKTKYILSAVLSAVIVCTTTSCMSQIAGQLVRQQMKDAASHLADAKDRKWSQINEKSYSSLLQNAFDAQRNKRKERAHEDRAAQNGYDLRDIKHD